MPHSIGSQLSDEDYQLIDRYQFGSPLSIYSLKPGPIRIMYGISLFLLMIAVGVPVFMITTIFMGWHETHAGDNFVAAMLVGLAVFSLLIGLFGLRIEIPHSRRERVLVCEQGLLLAKKKIRGTYVQAVRWNDILAVRRDFLRNYYIVHQGGAALTLIAYQNIDELVELIRQRSGVAYAVNHKIP